MKEMVNLHIEPLSNLETQEFKEFSVKITRIVLIRSLSIVRTLESKSMDRVRNTKG